MTHPVSSNGGIGRHTITIKKMVSSDKNLLNLSINIMQFICKTTVLCPKIMILYFIATNKYLTQQLFTLDIHN